jgi:hypothetical protein
MMYQAIENIILSLFVDTFQRDPLLTDKTERFKRCAVITKMKRLF